MTTNPQNGSSRPTVVLVHGAFAESASWDGVIEILQERGYTAIAAPNHLRSLSGDAEFVASVLDSIEGPVVLVGHSYGGSVISGAALGRENVRAMVFVAAFAPEEGESIGELSGLYPGSTLGETLQVRPAPGRHHRPLHPSGRSTTSSSLPTCPPGRPPSMAATQRPLRDVALNEASGLRRGGTCPSWFVIPGLDKNVPPEAQRFMAERAGAREILEIEGRIARGAGLARRRGGRRHPRGDGARRATRPEPTRSLSTPSAWPRAAFSATPSNPEAYRRMKLATETSETKLRQRTGIEYGLVDEDQFEEQEHRGASDGGDRLYRRVLHHVLEAGVVPVVGLPDDIRDCAVSGGRAHGGGRRRNRAAGRRASRASRTWRR
jgi:pimeloyl-ACP methyl ester carboxylesterase